MGLVRTSESDELFPLWPENLLPVQVFECLNTQWQIGPGSMLIGLYYEAIPVVMGLMQVADEARPDVFKALRHMERAAIDLVNG
jgi:hypothetical protein